MTDNRSHSLSTTPVERLPWVVLAWFALILAGVFGYLTLYLRGVPVQNVGGIQVCSCFALVLGTLAVYGFILAYTRERFWQIVQLVAITLILIGALVATFDPQFILG